MKAWLRKLLLNDRLLLRLGRWLARAQAAVQFDDIRKALSRCQSVGQGVKINGKIFISHPESLILGNNVHVGGDAYLFTLGGLTIGDHTHISRRLTVYTANHRTQGDRLPYDQVQNEKPVHIGKNVWIGMNVSIVPGITIGDGAIIGMGTIVSADVRPGSVVTGAATREVGERDLDHYQKLVQADAYSGANGGLRETNDCPPPCRLTDNECSSFFVASTGRAGSTTLAHVLSQHDDITCLHEPRPQLMRISTQYANQEVAPKETLSELKNLYETSVVQNIVPSTKLNQRVNNRRSMGPWPVFLKVKHTGQGPMLHNRTSSKQVYGESDQKYFNLITPVSQLLPQAKFIWLVRDGRDFVASAYSRGWFSEEDTTGELYGEESSGKRWSQYRLQGASCGNMTDSEWNRLSSFERCCWYWSYVNNTISEQLDKLPSEKWMLLKLEELEDSREKVLDFLDVKQSAWKIERWNAGKTQPPSWQSWDSEKKAAFEHLCGDLQSRLYPENKDTDMRSDSA